MRTVAEGREWSYGWQPASAQRLRFLIDFSYGTGLRAGELVHATLASIEIDAHGDHWLHVVGKGSKAGKVVGVLKSTRTAKQCLQGRVRGPSQRAWEAPRSKGLRAARAARVVV